MFVHRDAHAACLIPKEKYEYKGSQLWSSVENCVLFLSATFPPYHASCGPPLCQTPEEGHRFSLYPEEHPAVPRGHSKDQKFSSLYGWTKQCRYSSQPVKRCRTLSVEDHERIAAEVCDIILGHTRERFSFTNHLVSATLLQGDRFEQYNTAFPEDALSNTLKAYPVLNGGKLKTELSLIYSKEEFKACCGAVGLLQLFMENNLEEVFSETVTLLKILITTPMTTAEAERCFSTLKRIKTFLRNSMTQDRLNALAMLSMEKTLVTEMTDFNKNVIEKFAGQKERRAKFMFK
ncbi:uncharacterized protein LOC125802536 [Astyanax mexicanus]|uniref:uncharacterized protein LOC125802536 n=1 Tax=Astyanax mexicanus TaxID=7994 RepID=UPI0020CAC296|nr:uncharacterized protein LOC125802536 [Astyanax mexicanus]